MFQLLKKYRKGVSPVIAIVLLIALTVAAAAVIWTLTSGILDDASGHTLVVSNSASTINGTNSVDVSVTLRANSLTTLSATGTSMKSTPTGVTLTGTSFGFDAASNQLESGDNAVVITVTTTTDGQFKAGSYVINLSWSGDGDDPKLLEISFTL